ncbi:hypothetical protein [Thalassolituus sp.]|jgi:hypothetical protein|uniref:hypothetical protein n=1 Tax=Thalassolituus sp. TaxID=2030822 RepID=UPI002A8016AA|nr:hypothetical protein [Thalassolituus sp.]
MSKLASLLMDLLCHITIEPDDGLNPDDTADLQIDTWQALIHDLSDSELSLVKTAAQAKLTALESISRPSADEEQLMAILDAFINNELQ